MARRLFAGPVPAPAWLHRRELWHWLTPAAACVLALVIMIPGSNHHLRPFNASAGETFFATLLPSSATSNLQKTLILQKGDENMDLNVWPHPFLCLTGTQAVINIPTNRQGAL